MYLMRFTLSFREASRPEEEEEVRLGLKAGGAQAYRACNIKYTPAHFTHFTQPTCMMYNCGMQLYTAPIVLRRMVDSSALKNFVFTVTPIQI